MAGVSADGRSQRSTIPKEDAVSPMVSSEAVMITSVIDAKEGRDVAITDIPDAYLTADMDDFVVMVLEGTLAELLVKTASNVYQKYLGVGKDNKPVLYVQLRKALYGYLKSALLFYKRRVGNLQAYGFKINPYDPCVANKIVNGKQMTVCWHVDDLKISHVDDAEVTKILEWLEKTYGQLRTTRGKVHEYLGMTLDFSERGHVKIGMQ
eukprot:5981757-Ditylum_brightwellii.AAC.1